MKRLPPEPPKRATDILQLWLDAWSFEVQQGPYVRGCMKDGYFVHNASWCATVYSSDTWGRALILYRGRDERQQLIKVAELLEQLGAEYSWEYVSPWKWLALVVCISDKLWGVIDSDDAQQP